ncbi:MAG TPA: acyltransferase [Candidatus Nanoarchaeia archaeon]|nr:acyltransferase [Candidatus Nanoarchaeia archaeon]
MVMVNIQTAYQLIKNCRVGKDTKIWNFVNLYDCEIGDQCMVGPFVEIQAEVKIGNNCRVQSHSFLCSLLTVGDNVFIGHGVMFINDTKPPRLRPHWQPILVERGVVIGSNATIFPVTIGENAIIGAGAVVMHDIPANAVVAGNPAKVIRMRRSDDTDPAQFLK